MLRKPLIRIILTVLAGLVLVLIVYSSFRQSRVACEVCIVYRGTRQCRTASGATEEDAIRTATDNACTFVSSGMSDSIQCSNTPPASVTCGRGTAMR